VDPFDEFGLFWTPERPDLQRSGRLRFDHGSLGLRLSVMNAFEDEMEFYVKSQSHPGYEVVLGQLESGDLVTLTHAQITESKLRLGGGGNARIELIPRFLFRGVHLEAGESTEFSSLELRFEHLDAWAIQDRMPIRALAENEMQVSTAAPASPIGNAFGGVVSIDYFRREQTGTTRVAFERGSIVRFEPIDPVDMPKLLSTFCTPMQHLLTFAVGVPTHVTSIEVTRADIGTQYGEHWIPKSIKVAYQGWPAPTDSRSPVQMRFTLGDIGTRFEEILRNWEGFHQKHERSMVLLFALSLGLDLYLDSKFLFAVQALELFHRKEWPDGVLPEDEQKARVKSLTDLVDDDELRKWLTGKLAFSNEFTLKERLEQIIGYAGSEIRPALREKFSKVAKDTRNYLTHYNESLKSKAAHDEDMWVLANECASLLEFCMLRALGFDGPTTFQMSSQTPRFQDLLHRRGLLQSPMQVTVTPGVAAIAAAIDDGVPDADLGAVIAAAESARADTQGTGAPGSQG